MTSFTKNDCLRFYIMPYDLFGHVHAIGFWNVVREFRCGILRLNPFKLRRKLRELRAAEAWAAKEKCLKLIK